jgi:hypothetical protein
LEKGDRRGFFKAEIPLNLPFGKLFTKGRGNALNPFFIELL